MKSIMVQLALPVGNQVIEPFAIDGQLILSRGDCDKMRTEDLMRTYGNDAQAIFDTLITSLPGGTLSRLYALFAAHYVNNLLVAEKAIGL